MNSTEAAPNQRYGSVFCIFLVALAFLCRDNPNLDYARLQYLLVGLCVINVLAGWMLRRWSDVKGVPAATVIANCALITSIVATTGGPDSELWVLYLLPIYTVCLYMEGGHLVVVVAGIIAFNVLFHGLTVDREPGSWDLFGACVKAGMFIFAAGATWTLAARERRARAKLAEKRYDVERLEAQIGRDEPIVLDLDRFADIGVLASGVAHDLRNPITVMLGSVTVLLSDPSLPERIRRDLERIRRAAEQCRTISLNLLELAAGQTKLEPCDLREVLDKAMVMYEPTLAGRGIRVHRNYGGAPIWINGSAAELQRVVLNLAANAGAAMGRRGELTVSIMDGQPSASGAPYVDIVIDDTGPGFSPDTLTQIFKPFNTAKKAGEGVGLGLYLCRQITVDHGGRMRVENRRGGGARVVLSFPAVQEPAVPAAAAAA